MAAWISAARKSNAQHENTFKGTACIVCASVSLTEQCHLAKHGFKGLRIMAPLDGKQNHTANSMHTDMRTSCDHFAIINTCLKSYI